MAEKKDTPQESNELPRIRTYAADMSKVIKSRGETLASIVNKEQTSQQQPSQSGGGGTPTWRQIAIGTGIAVFLLAGIGTLIGVFVFSPDDETTVKNQGIIFANKVETLSVSDDRSLAKQFAGVRKEQNFSLGEILQIIPIKNGTPLAPAAIIETLGAPGALSREVTDVMVGVHSFDRNQPFILIRLGVYDRSFAALLSWEPDMGRDLNDFFAPLGKDGDKAPLLTFNDSILENFDARVSQTAWPIIYTFPEQQLVILTTNEFTLREIMTRLSATRVVF